MSDCQHKWVEEYYGWLCTTCGLFYAYGCAPWEDHDFDEEYEPEYEDDDE